MSSALYDQVVQLADQLNDKERAALIQHLQMVTSRALHKPKKYQRPDLDLTDEEINAYLHEIATEWEQEMDELFDED